MGLVVQGSLCTGYRHALRCTNGPSPAALQQPRAMSVLAPDFLPRVFTQHTPSALFQQCTVPTRHACVPRLQYATGTYLLCPTKQCKSTTRNGPRGTPAHRTSPGNTNRPGLHITPSACPSTPSRRHGAQTSPPVTLPPAAHLPPVGSAAALPPPLRPLSCDPCLRPGRRCQPQLTTPSARTSTIPPTDHHESPYA